MNGTSRRVEAIGLLEAHTKRGEGEDDVCRDRRLRVAKSSEPKVNPRPEQAYGLS